MDTKVVGDRIAKYRKIHNYTQEGLAKMVAPSCTRFIHFVVLSMIQSLC